MVSLSALALAVAELEGEGRTAVAETGRPYPADLNFIPYKPGKGWCLGEATEVVAVARWPISQASTPGSSGVGWWCSVTPRCGQDSAGQPAAAGPESVSFRPHDPR